MNREILRIQDPLRFAKLGWPKGFTQVRIPNIDRVTKRVTHFTRHPYWFYDKQREIIYSVERTPQTFVPAANKVGKDFTAGFIAVKQFVTNKVCRIIATSVADHHLRVLWGEIMRFINTSSIPLKYEDGGILVVNDKMIRKVVNGVMCPISYLKCMVSEKGEGLAGHHAPYTLAIGDEASGLDNLCYTQMMTWAKRMLFFGNCGTYGTVCNNFFRNAVENGPILHTEDMLIKQTDSEQFGRISYE